MKKPETTEPLDTIFEALANKHRREIVYALSLQPHSISQLALMRELSLPAMYKHIKILEHAGLITEKKVGRRHFLALQRQSLIALQEWLTQYQVYWGSDDETLINYAEYIKKGNPPSLKLPPSQMLRWTRRRDEEGGENK